MKHIGFTGTRNGLPGSQIGIISYVMGRLAQSWAVADATSAVTAHHGDCVGADATFHDLCRQRGWRVVGHIPNINKFRAFCQFDEERAPLPYLVRNQAIVDAADVMIAGPHDHAEVGGTWATIRYTRKAGKPLAIVWPDGRVTYERWPHA